MQLRTLDLFAGAGGLTAGVHQASDAFTTVRAVEMDVAAAATFEANHGAGTVHAGPIEDWLRDEDVPEVDVVLGGPPCQGFSALNRAKVGIERNTLWQRYVDTILRARPKWFVVENVSNFFKAPEFVEFLEETRPEGRLSEYALDGRVLLAADYGAPQLRRRTVMIGHHRDLAPPAWPVPTTSREGYATVGQAFAGLVPTVVEREFPDRRATFAGHEFQGRFRTHELHVTRHYTELSLARFRHIPAEGNRMDLPPELMTPGWRKHTTGTGDVMGRLRVNRPSVTIRTEFFKPEKGRYLHPSQPRAITHHEAARLQGFPDDYLWVGNKIQIARQIGNAVPLPLGRAIGHVLAEAAGVGSRPTEPDRAVLFP